MNGENFHDAALVVLGHGTTQNESSAAPVFQQAAELRRRNIFAEVREAFWKQEPHIKKVLPDISAPSVFIVPLFISEGWFTSDVIPRELGFATHSILSTQRSTIYYCRPVGTHERMTEVILSCANKIVEQFPFPRAPQPKDVTLFIAGHGTEKNENSRKAIERQVELIRALNRYAGVHAIFMEESPRIADCYKQAAAKNLVVVPFFISDGLHVQEDIPVLLGEAKPMVEKRRAAGQPAWRNPTEKNGKLVWYSTAVGSDPRLADVILERVREAAKNSSSSSFSQSKIRKSRTRTRRITIKSMSKLRIGFLSTANIGRTNWKAVFNSGNCVVSAVASREVKRSRQFIREGQREFPFAAEPAALGSYDELIAAPNVDAVYIPLPTGLRKEWVLRAAAAGKHVICEKPCGVSCADVRDLTDACRKNRVQFMDGVMFMHNPRLPRIRKVLDDKKNVGSIRRISSAFSFCGTDEFSRGNIRLDGRLEPAGCLGDLGWYCIRFTLWTMKWQLPRTVTGRILSKSKPTGGRVPAPDEFSGELFFDDNVSAEFYCSFVTANQQWAFVSGRKGWLRIPDFVHPFNSREPAFEVNRTEIRVREAGPGKRRKLILESGELGHATAQNTIMFRNFARQVFSGKLNGDWPMWALKTQQVQDACLEAARNNGSVKL